MSAATGTRTGAGSIYVVVAPSGAGKTSLVAQLLRDRPEVRLSISFTTRAPRPREQAGRDYFFVDAAEFEQRRNAGEFLESAFVHGNHYATSRRWLDENLVAGRDIVLEIDWQGARQVREAYPHAVGVFILPPSIEELRRRLVARGQDDPAVVERRLAVARDEIAHAGEFDFVIINQDFDTALRELTAVVDAGRLRRRQQFARHRELLAALGLSAPG